MSFGQLTGGGPRSLIPDNLSATARQNSTSKQGPQLGPSGNNVTSVGRPVIQQPYDPKDVQDLNEKGYTREERDSYVDWAKGKGTAQRDAARGREQQLGNYPYYEWNLAQNNPRGNLNGMSYPSTLRYSRLADMVNNQFHYRPGHQTNVYVGGRGFEKSADSATVSRWDPIETEEMRQMKANRELDARARQAGVDLQSRIQGYPQEIQEATDQLERSLAQYISQMDDQFKRFWIQQVMITQYGGSWQNYFQMLLQQFMTEYGLQKSDRIFSFLRGLSELDANIYASATGLNYVAPNFIQYASQLVQDYLIQMVRDGRISMEEALRWQKAWGAKRDRELGSLTESIENNSYSGGKQEREATKEAESSRYSTSGADLKNQADRRRIRGGR